MNGKELKGALRELFEDRVMNHGDYTLVYAQPSGPGPSLVLGYRLTPLELVLCPVEVEHLLCAGTDGHRAATRPTAPIRSLDLTNAATVADTGTGYQVQTVTGFRMGFEVDEAPRILTGATAAESGDGTVVVDQGEDAEDFHQFMGHFMDVLDAYYQVPNNIESLQTLPANA
ncbi:hypothetical protein ACFFIO_12405 [Citricoccus parietis]|uniref:Uncharacterized protein n=1 Tax=Citricoccus parietis TaxID=592307 RepID=A0ABV6F6Z9_9MICC